MSLNQQVPWNSHWQVGSVRLCVTCSLRVRLGTQSRPAGCRWTGPVGVLPWTWVKGNDRADRLAGKATLTSGSLLGRSQVLRSLRHYLRAQSQGHHTIDRLEERGVEKGSARRSSLKGRERAIVSQTNIGTVSKATLGKLLRDGVAHRYHLELNWTELNWAVPNSQIKTLRRYKGNTDCN